ncbi:conserved hypothetical protein [Vibrio coralliirubri]|nr:conserved hypothetical protein [Vibrio coralliirubri]
MMHESVKMLCELFNMSRGSAGSRTLVSMLSAEGIKAGRFKVRQIMREADLMSKQPGSYRYRHVKAERLDIPN